METVLIMLAVGTLNIVCFFVGAKVGQKVSKDEPIEMPTLNPMKAVREHRAEKEKEMEQNRKNTILRNIDRFDGTPRGQEDVPRG
jgi:hypothetical protein